ncbi:hypothetical protein WME73_37210 [Sorangium sp. So ce302]|uniref:hypothetical protein n=1 Tax=unclassified Sorangium TaxID=2621164 RepID=UPI003F5F7D35
MRENASNPSAPVSGPGVGRALFPTGDSPLEGAVWSLVAPGSGELRRLYFRTMFALSSPYAASTGLEGFFLMTVREVTGGTLGQSTIGLLAAQKPTNLDEALSVPMRFSLGVLTPNGPSYPQTSGPELARGTWHQIEAYFVANTPDQEDGVGCVWLDGVLIVEKAGVKWANGDFYWSEASWFDRRIDAAFGVPDGGQHVDHDHLEVFWSQTRE